MIEKDDKRPKVLIQGAENFGRGGRSVITWNLTDPLSPDFQVDFVSKIKVKDLQYFDKIKERQGQIIVEPQTRNKFTKLFMRLFVLPKHLRKEKYDISHINADDAWEAMKGILFAKLSGINHYVVHAHTTKSNHKNKIGKLLIFFSQKYLLNFSNLEKVACSQEAARFLFGLSEDVKIIENGICLEDYTFNQITRREMRERLGISEQAKIVGTVGRLSEEKNPLFILNIIEELIKMNPTYQFLWIGDGGLKDELVIKSKEKGLMDHIKFLGNRSDVNDLLQVFDVFILPSLYEGFGIVNIEAQVSGLPCLVSDAVPDLAKVNDNFHFLSIKEDATVWAQHIIDMTDQRILSNHLELFRKRGFDIKQGAEKLRASYERLSAK
ncbi:TPA: glycosyltransferase [Streptococcus suis]|nr:glycosyltransferase [Streptococcus suis]